MRFAHVPYEFPAQSVVIDGLRIAYADINTSHGTPVVFLHGVGGSSNWFTEAYKRLLGTRRVIGVDWIGFGKSDKPRLDDAIPFHVEMLARFLDTLEIERASIVGHSMGGLVASHFAIEHPERLERLVLVAPAGVREVPPDARPAIVEFWSYNRVQNMDAIARRAWWETMVAGWNDSLERLLELHVELAESLDHREWARAGEAAIASILANPIGAKLAQIEAPTLLIWGVDDQIVPYSNAALACDMIPNAQLVAIEGCGHLPMFEKPDEFNNAVVEFVTSGTISSATRKSAALPALVQDVTPWPGLTVEIGRLATMLYTQRDACLELTKDFTVDEVAWSPSPMSDSIGGLLLHLGGEVAWYYYELIVGEDVPNELWTKFQLGSDGAVRPFSAPRKSAERLLRDVSAADELLRHWLATTTDASLNKVFKKRDGTGGMTLRHLLWHLIEDAVQCRGQIALLGRLIELGRPHG
jgi:pimeloyl-ACP methyl ester carboxylesterase